MRPRLTIKIVALAAFWATVLAAVPARADGLPTSRSCNNWLIRGTYGFTIEGNKLGGPGPIGPQVGVAMTVFDGHGNLKQLDSVTVAGTTVADFTHPVASGTYQVNPDCTGTFTINFTDGRPTVNTSFVLVEAGWEIDAVVTSVGPPGAEVQGLIATRSIGKRRVF
ncbi:MAG TPA: hypothetical protein VLV49_14195 [Terriglobales bacterium]|nr:hypothetical protein [Terriglobales bacterium]